MRCFPFLHTPDIINNELANSFIQMLLSLIQRNMLNINKFTLIMGDMAPQERNYFQGSTPLHRCDTACCEGDRKILAPRWHDPFGDSPPDVIEILVISSMTTGGHQFRVALYFFSKKNKINKFTLRSSIFRRQEKSSVVAVTDSATIVLIVDIPSIHH